MPKAFAIATVHVCRKPGERDPNDRRKIKTPAEIEVVPAGKVFTADQKIVDELIAAGAARKPTKVDLALAAGEDDDLDQVEVEAGHRLDPTMTREQLEAKSRAELDTLAADHGVDISHARNKGDVVEALLAEGI